MTVLSVDQITQQMVNQLRSNDPAMSAEVGTPERELIEAAAEMIASSQVDFSVLDSQHDLDTMSGGRLDAFGNIFGFSRQQSTSATGVVTFARTSTTTTDIIIPAGTQVSAPASDPTFPDVVYTVIQTVTMAAGTSTVDAPVQAAIPGTIGNLPANSVTGFAGLRTIIGITLVYNQAAFAGGVDAETDDQFRVRLKNSLFRNQAGTQSQFLGLALSGENVTKAVILGPIARYQEYVQVPSADDSVQNTAVGDGKSYDPTPSNFLHKRTTEVSTIPYSKYTYDSGYYLTDGSVATTAVFFKPFVDFWFNRKALSPQASLGGDRTFDSAAVTAHQPNVTILDPTTNTALAGGTVVLLEHQYISKHSRNDIPSGVMNAVDVFINASKPRTGKSQEVYPGGFGILQNTNVNVWTYQNSPVINFRRVLDSSASAVGNLILPLAWQPVVDVPDTIQVKDASITYTMYKAKYKNGGEYYYDAAFTRVANYFAVAEVNGYAGTIRARNGFEFRDGKLAYAAADPPGTPSGPDPVSTHFIGSQFSVSYTYDANVSELQAIMESNKQVTTDVLVHRAKDRFFTLNITIMYTPGASQSVVNLSINAALQAFWDAQYFGSAIQLSDLLQVVHNVPGVDNVRWTHDVTSTTHKVEEVNADGSAIASSPSTGFSIVSGHSVTDNDFFLSDNELVTAPSVNQTVIVVRAANTWQM